MNARPAPLGLRPAPDAAGYPATLSRPAVSTSRRGVSVVIPFRHAGAGLDAAVGSVWAQAGVDTQVVLVALDATERDTLRAERLAGKGVGHVLVPRGPILRGEALRRGIAAATHGVLSTLDEETCLRPHALEAALATVAADPRAVAYADLECRHSTGPLRWSFAAMDGLKGGALTRHLAGRSHVPPRHLALSRALYGRTTGFDPRLDTHAEWSLSIELGNLAGAWVRHPDVGADWTPGHPRRGVEATLWTATFDLHLAFLSHADMLATRFGPDAVALLRSAAGIHLTTDTMRDGWDRLDARAGFEGNVLGDLRALGAALHASPMTLPPQARLDTAYATIAEPPR